MRGESTLSVDRAQTTGDALIGVMLVIVIAAAIGFVGVDVNSEIEDSTDIDLNGEDVTVTNESVDTVVFDSTTDRFFYTVNDANRAATVDDDERVFNTTSGAELTEATDYEWFTANATLRVDNTSEVSNNSDEVVITYNYTEKSTNFADAQDNISGGFTDAMSLTDIVFLVLMFSVILSALVAFRRR